MLCFGVLTLPGLERIMIELLRMLLKRGPDGDKFSVSIMLLDLLHGRIKPGLSYILPQDHLLKKQCSECIVGEVILVSSVSALRMDNLGK
ncbi:hypothetical protein FRX31_002094 [Thalictrum thalictroides]|uniref:Uncharacterized protein n=1 Tax=Thalictrum thalictroides TaxID=46969 RepID=A0A7J6XFK5_THATH|nr:hypothetical protein FRX31_002094 [Thalictrum thalictroides]